MTDKQLKFTQKSKLPVILQDEIAECGHACIAMISCFFGNNLNLNALRQRYKPSIRGVSLYAMIQIMEQLGLQTRAIRIQSQEIAFVKCPAILHWNNNHFVVLKKATKNNIIIHDPAKGVCKYSLKEFNQFFSGIVLEIEHAAEFTIIQQTQKLSLYKLIKTVSGYRQWIAVLVILSIILELFNFTNPLILSYITDHITLNANNSQIITIILGLIILIILQIITDYTRSNLILFIRTNITAALSSNTLKHLLSLPLKFFENRNKGDIQAKFQSIHHMQSKISTDFINTLLDGILIVAYSIVIFFYNINLAIITIVGVMLQLLLRSLSYHTIKQHTSSALHLHAKAASIFLETLHAIQSIKSFIKENMQLKNWRNAYIDALNVEIRVSKYQIIQRVLQQLVTNLEYIIIIYIGAKLIISNQLSSGMLIAFLGYRLIIVNKATMLLQNIIEYRLVSVTLERLGDIIFHPAEHIAKQCINHTEINGELRIKNLSFQYESDSLPIIDNINIDIKAKEKVAIIGPSGCGKSTLIKIIMGLLNPTSGSILIDEIPIREYGMNNYLQLIGSVMQDDTLLSGTILDNITFFSEDYDLNLVYQVAKIANIDHIIKELPMGYNTIISELGSNLSGGQKQRILLARALYKKPKILILDEATSHLDQENEKQINLALKDLNITQIIVAHRQETINMADRVIEL